MICENLISLHASFVRHIFVQVHFIYDALRASTILYVTNWTWNKAARVYSCKTNPFSEFFRKTSQTGCASLHYMDCCCIFFYVMLFVKLNIPKAYISSRAHRLDSLWIKNKVISFLRKSSSVLLSNSLTNYSFSEYLLYDWIHCSAGFALVNTCFDILYDASTLLRERADLKAIVKLSPLYKRRNWYSNFKRKHNRNR